MEYTGLYLKYPLNRTLTSQEWENELIKNKRIDIDTTHQLSAIRVNSTYMEMADKFYPWKGFLSTLLLFGILSMVLVYAAMWFVSISTADRLEKDIYLLLGILIVIIPFVVVFGWLLRKECFFYTHLPLRFNRKERTVHVFRPDGAVTTAKWDEIFFCMRQSTGNFWDVVGHVLDKDRKTVLETFPLPIIAGGNKIGEEAMTALWEFVRRYMEEGPEDAVKRVEFFLPIADQRESMLTGFRILHAHGGQNLFAYVFYAFMAILIAPGRRLAILTSRIPQWPREVESVCQVEPNDPFVRDARNNPPDTM